MTSSHSETSSVLSSDHPSNSIDITQQQRQRKRRFGSALSGKPGLAKAQRDEVAQAVRQSTTHEVRPKLVAPPDYENFLVKYRTVLENDPSRDLVFFPRDDITQASEPQKHRTAVPSASEKDITNAKSLLAQQCLKLYTSDWSLVQFNYSKYGGDYVPLSRQYPCNELNELIYEIDLVEEENEELESPDGNGILDQGQRVLKEGYLYKGPDATTEGVFVNLRAFKKRYCYLRQDFDGSYKLDFYKDKPKGSSASTLTGVKATVYLELVSEIIPSPKRGKYSFELKLLPNEDSVNGGTIGGRKQQSTTPRVLVAAENETQMDEWIQTLKAILDKLAKIARKTKTEETSSVASSHTSEADSGREDTLEMLKAPDYVKFCKETDDTLLSKHSTRQNPFAVYTDLEPLPDGNDQTSLGDAKIKPPMDKFGIRFLIECKAMTILLPVPDGAKMASQVEPFFVTLFLFDARDSGRRISENFYADLNPQGVKKFLPGLNASTGDIAVVSSSGGLDIRLGGEPVKHGVKPSRLWSTDRKALFSVTHPHSDVYLVARIDKVLQGPISTGQEVYLRPDPKTASKFAKSVPQICTRLGRYRMPFAWTAKPVFQQFIGGTESAKDTVGLFRHEGDRSSDEDLVRWIAELKKPEKGSGKLQPLAQASITINVDVTVKPETLPGCVTSSYLPISSSNTTPSSASPSNHSVDFEGPTIFEIQSFPSQDVTVADVEPNTTYQNLIYVYPWTLEYGNQRHFSKARNICCWVEFRESDAGNATALKCLYGRYGLDSGVFVHRMGTVVTHHQTSPQWYDEVKAELPVNLHAKHHFLFTFVHIGVESAQKKRDDGKSGNTTASFESVVGYAWLPLMKGGRLSLDDDISLPVAATLPDGYLSCEALGFGKGYAGPDIKWVDSGRQLFRLSVRFASTIWTRDPNLQSFFNSCQRMKGNGTLGDAGSRDTTKAPPNKAWSSRRATTGDVVPVSILSDDGPSTDAKSPIVNNVDSKADSALFTELTKVLFSVDRKCMVEFLQAILNQLFSVLAIAANEEIALSAMRAMIHVVHEACKANKKDALKSYIKYIFKPTEAESAIMIHEELAKLGTLLLRPSRTEPTATAVYVKNVWFFMDVMVKSMCQRLLTSGRIKMSRTERFSAEFQYKLEIFIETLTLYLCQNYKTMPDECRAANRSLGYFLRAALALMDRGFVFGLIYFVCHKLDAMESKTLKMYKIDFLQIICQYEHFLPLNIPVFCGKEGSGPYRRNAAPQDGGTATTSSPVPSRNSPTELPSPQKRHTSLFQRLLSFGVGMLNTGLAGSGIANFVTGAGFTYGSGEDETADTTAMDLAHEFTLSDDYCSNHYLVGLLLRHIDYSICESRDLRKRLIAIMRNLLAKHSYDDRCQGKLQSNVAALYFPLIPLLMEHLNHLELRHVVNASTPTNTLSVPLSTRESTAVGNRTPVMGEQASPSSMVALRHSNSERSILTGGKRQMSLWEMPVPPSPGAIPRGTNRNVPLRQDSNGSSSTWKTALTIANCNVDESFDADVSSSAPTSADSTQSKEDADDQYSEISDNKSIATLVQHSVPNSARERSPAPSTLPQMLSQTEAFLAYSKFDDNEIKDLLICAVFVLKNVNRDAMKWFWQQCDRQGLMEFLRLLDLLLYHFKYQGKQRIMRITSNKLRSSNRVQTLPSPKGKDPSRRSTTVIVQDLKPSKRDSSIVESPFSVLQEAHLAQEVNLVVLDCLAAFVCTQKALMTVTPRSEFLEKISDMYYSMIGRQSSADVLRQVIASLKLLIKNYSSAFLEGPTNLCNDLCRKLVECCNCSISLVQADACNLLYLLMRMNYEHTGKKNFSRIHQQVIISLSQLLGDGMNLNNPVFNRALSILNGFAGSDKHCARFASEVKEVVRRKRTVLMATSQLKEHSDDPDMLADLQKSLADSYAQSPRLRETWLQNLARLHVKRQHYAEAAQCFLHMAAVIAEVLKAAGKFQHGAEQFSGVSNNVLAEEALEKVSISSLQDESMDTLGYDTDAFVNRVIQCAELMSKADRFEATGPLYRCVTPILEYQKDYEALTDAYATLHEAYQKATSVNKTGRRILGTYFRVRFYGQMHFEVEHGKDYVYREPKFTPLSEFTERLSQQYGSKFGGGDVVRLITDSNPVNVASLDPKFAYIQVSHVEPYHESTVSQEGQVGDYDRHTNVSRFFYDCPFTLDGRPGRTVSVADQCRRRFIVSISPCSFPYVVRRIQVTEEALVDMNPLEAAIDELQTKMNELKIILQRTPVDLKSLQLRLQGAIQPTVNAGPLAYAEAFCKPMEIEKYGSAEIQRLSEVYRELLRVCWEALEINDRLIMPDQFEYQQSLLRYFRDTVQRLNVLFGQQMMPLSNDHSQQSPNDPPSDSNHRRSERRHSSKRASTFFSISSNDGNGN